MTVRKVAADAGVKMTYAATPRTSYKPREVRVRSTEVLGRSVLALYEQLGVAPPAELIALARPANAESNGKSY